MVKLRVTGAAAENVALPACEAVIVQVPAARMVRVLAATVQTDVVDEE